MTDIIIVSLAPWARTSAWWRAAVNGLNAREAPRSWTLTLRYFISGRGGDTGALSAEEATIIRGWATSIPGWRERAERGQYPLRFNSYMAEVASQTEARTSSR